MATDDRQTPEDHLNTIGGRLRWAIDRRLPRGRERGIRLFQRDLEERAKQRADTIPGVTLPSIMTYLNDETEPSAAFVREAADLCGVRPGWLLFGEEPRTEAEVEAEAGKEREGDHRRMTILRLKARCEGLAHCEHVVAVALIHHADLWFHAHDAAPNAAANWDEYVTGVWEDLRRPLEGRAPLDWPAFSNYAMAYLSARNLLLHIPTTDPDGED